MRIGLVLDNTLPLQDQLQQAVLAERDGFDACWLLHFIQFGYDALTVIALAGQRTSRIELGTAVIPIYPYQPLALAGHALTAQVACGGRLTLGLGASHRPVVEGVLGLSYAAPASYMREYLTIVRALVQDGQAELSGQYFRVKANLRVPGATACPIMIAALAPAMLRVAGALADGTITWMAGPKTLATHIIPSMTHAAATAQRPAPRICAALPIAVTDDPAAARSIAAQRFQNYGHMANYRRLLDMEGAAGPEDVAIVGDETTCERQIRALAQLGVTDFAALRFPASDDSAASLARTTALLKQLIGNIHA